jgi:glutamyl/glutaminyl-tRNA synthetase
VVGAVDKTRWGAIYKSRYLSRAAAIVNNALCYCPLAWTIKQPTWRQTCQHQRMMWVAEPCGFPGHDKYRIACPHRESPVSESLAEFQAMRHGKYSPWEAVLRMKQDLESGNSQMWDLAANRVLDDKHPHCKTGNGWKIFPTYDFAHCLCDSFEGITHSSCTTEFEPSSVSYEGAS